MKIIRYTVVLLVLLTSSCNKWLDLLPENEQVTDRYWNNKEEVEAVLGAAYVSLQESVNTMITWGEARGNTLTAGGFTATGLAELRLFRVLPSNAVV
jgi:hypothetical protein